MEKAIEMFDWHQVHVDDLKKTCRIFQHWDASDAKDWGVIRIHGSMVNTPECEYCVYKIHVMQSRVKDDAYFKFCVCIFTEDGDLKIHPFMNGMLDYS